MIAIQNPGRAFLATAMIVLLAATPLAGAARITAPAGGDYLAGTVDVTWQRELGAGSRIDLYLEASGTRLDPPLCSPCTGNGFALDTTRYADAREYVLVILENTWDNGGRRTTTSGSLVFDNTAPSTLVNLDGVPGDNGWYQDDVTVTLVAADETAGVASTMVAVDGGAAAAYAGSFRVGGDGVHTVDFWSVDRAGNAEARRSVEIRIDGTAPAYEMVDPKEGNAYVLDMRDPVGAALPVTLVVGDMTVVVEATDATSGVDRVEFSIDGVVRFVDTEAPYEFAWSAGDERAGEHTVAARAVDVAGNSIGSAVEVITVPTTVEGIGNTALDGGL